jgi:sugar lactone lactonase YvrE
MRYLLHLVCATTCLLPAVAIAADAIEIADQAPEAKAAPAKQKLKSGAVARAVLGAFGLATEEQPAEESEAEAEAPNADEHATHAQTRIIKVGKDGDAMTVNAFCLDADGNILACCGAGPGEIRRFDPQGKLLAKWDIEVKPESIDVDSNGTILVAGGGELFRFSPEGKVLHSADSPHARAMRKEKEKIREQIVKQFEARQNSMAANVERYEAMIEQLEKKKEGEDLSESEQRVLDQLKTILPQLKVQAKQQAEQPKPQISEEQIEQQVERMMSSKLRVAAITADSKHVYIATPATTGYGYAVWRMNDQFEEGKQVVDGLRGCCGQMDIKASDAGIFVAENSRHRIVRFDADGKETTAWGKRDRTGAEGFTSCCNPANVCFGAGGDIYSSESSTGRIKRFSVDGELKDFVGTVNLAPGCKNVSIDVSPDGRLVYMLDITRNHIVVMEQKSAEPEAADATTAKTTTDAVQK